MGKTIIDDLIKFEEEEEEEEEEDDVRSFSFPDLSNISFQGEN